MKRFLHIDVPNELRLLANQFAMNGHQLFLVGGAVRDAVLGNPPKDFDVATDASPDRVTELVSNIAGAKVLEVGKAFGVVKLVFPSTLEFEIATFRIDVGAGRRPDSVVFSTIEEDVKRRDLTINALFWDIYTHEVVDLVGGLNDIANGVVRTVGNPNDRFNEDRLRVLRAVRFAAQLGCELHPDTERAIRTNPSLKGVSAERIRDEFLKGLHKARSVTHFLMMLDRLRLLPEVFPGLRVNIDHFREVRDANVLLALLLVDNFDPPIAEASLATRLNQLKYTTDEVRQVTFFRSFRFLSQNSGCCSALKLHREFNISGLSEQQVRQFAGIYALPNEAVVNAFFKYSPSVKAEELMEQGFKGKELGVELTNREEIEFLRLLHAEETRSS